ncbi:MAG: YggS family pyridoxal phosphate-dependent enzyme [Bacteroidales bacterium]
MIAQNLSTIQQKIPANVLLVAVSKTKPISDIQEAYNTGIRDFGENKVQELTEKHEQLPHDIAWHFIGHLQSNKVKYIAPFVSLIHAVDSYKLLSKINKEAEKNNRIIHCLIQFHIAQEDSKFGLLYDNALTVIKKYLESDMKHVVISGVMGMASFTDNTSQIHKEFSQLHSYFTSIKQDFFSTEETFKHISMGMSQDFPIAIEEGSTIVRIGSKIFGERNYT